MCKGLSKLRRGERHTMQLWSVRTVGLFKNDMQLEAHFPSALSCVGEGSGNPLQCSCLENPRAGGAWWAAVYGVTQSRTRLKRLSSSSWTWNWLLHLLVEAYTNVDFWIKSKLNLCLSWLMAWRGWCDFFFFFEVAIEFKLKRRKTVLPISLKAPAFMWQSMTILKIDNLKRRKAKEGWNTH